MEITKKIVRKDYEDRKSYMKAYLAEYRKTEKYKKYMKEYASRPHVRIARRDYQRRYMRDNYFNPDRVEFRREYRKRPHVRKANILLLRRHSEQYKEAAINIYSNGDACCAICRNADIDVLCLDHIANNGSQHRAFLRSVFGGGATNIYRMVKKLDYPTGLQVLCYNCNMKKELTRKRRSRLLAS